VTWEAYGVMDVLLKKGADVNAADKRGNTPLHVAALLGRPRAATVLLNSKASVNAVNRLGYTPLGLALHEREWRDARKKEPLDRLIGILTERGAKAKAKEKP